jgi:hypothetical protein
MLVHPKRHSVQIRVKVGVKLDGSLTAIETELYGDTGAYASLGKEVMERATTHSTGPYEIANVSSVVMPCAATTSAGRSAVLECPRLLCVEHDGYAGRKAGMTRSTCGEECSVTGITCTGASATR